VDLINSADDRNARLDTKGMAESAERQGQGQYFAGLMIDLMPEWLKKDIRENKPSLCDWDAGLGNGADLLCDALGTPGAKMGAAGTAGQRDPDTQLPTQSLAAPENRWDVIFSSNILARYPDPWTELEGLARQATDALVVLVPFKEYERATGHNYTFSSTNIPARVGAFQLIYARSRHTSIVPGTRWLGRQILLVFASRALIERAQVSLADLCFDDADAAFEERLASLTARNQDLVAEKAKLAAQRWEAERWYQDSERFVRELLGSRSWKISAPFRSVVIAARKGRDMLRTLRSEQSAVPEPVVDLDSFLRSHSRILIVNSDVQFDPAGHGSSIALAAAAADAGHGVVFVGWQSAEDEAFTDRSALVRPNLFQISRHDLKELVSAVKRVRPSSTTFLVTVASTEVAQSLLALEAAGVRVIYHVLDDWAEANKVGQAPWYEEALEKHLIVNANKVTVVTSELRDRLKRPDEVHVVGNGYTPVNFALPDEGRTYKQTAKVGCFGPIGEGLFDWQLVFALAANCPQLSIEIVSEVPSGCVAEQAGHYPNLVLLGSREARECSEIAREWRAGLIPYRTSRLGAAADPLQVYAYLDLGLRVVSSGLPQLGPYPNTQDVEGERAFIAAVQDLTRQPSEWVPVKDFLQAATWASRLERILQ